MIEAYSITIRNNLVSEGGYERLVDSSNQVGNNFDIQRFEAITPPDVDSIMKQHKIKWNYPWVGKEVDFASGLTKSAYKTPNPKSRIACALSHYLLWRLSAKQNKTILVLEHDAEFIHKIDFNPDKSKMFVLGINNPLGATRKAREFYTQVVNSKQNEIFVPWIDDQSVPQGLAGNSAYFIKPAGAKKMLDLVDQFGLWPNDALMCRQLVSRIGVTKKFYTKVQGLKSTTT